MKFSGIYFSTATGAQTFLHHLKDFIEDYGYATVVDLYNYIGVSPAPYHDASSWGWKDLSRAFVTGNGERWYISFPKIERVRTENGHFN